LDDFVCKSEIVILDYFNIEEDYNFDAITIGGLIKLTEDKMDKRFADNLKRMLKDMDYVHEMKKLENYVGKAGLDAAVPVSGLILSRFHRFQNELQTVKEVGIAILSYLIATQGLGKKVKLMKCTCIVLMILLAHCKNFLYVSIALSVIAISCCKVSIFKG
jgi:hypothetical protein